MSTSLSTQAMVSEIQRRLPIGLPSQVCMDRLNEAYRWVCSQGSFVWLQKYFAVTVTGATAQITLPTDFDPGRPAYLTYNSVEIPYKPYDVAIRHQLYNGTVLQGQFSVWTFYTEFVAPVPPATTPTYKYVGLMLPPAALPVAPPAVTVAMVYHTSTGSPLAISSTGYFPTPDSFDSFLIDMAESELRRTYGLAGFENLITKAQGSISMLLDAYRSTKPTMMGMMDQQRQTAESQAAKAE